MLRFYGPVNPMGSCQAWSVYLTTRLLGRLSSKRLTSIVHILSPETDNCPSWISGRKRMTEENVSWSISTKECCQPQRGLNPWLPGLQSDSASNWATMKLLIKSYLYPSTGLKGLDHSLCRDFLPLFWTGKGLVGSPAIHHTPLSHLLSSARLQLNIFS